MFIYKTHPKVQLSTLIICFLLFSLKRPCISENFNVDVEQQRIMPLSYFSSQMFVFVQESSGLSEQRHNQCFQIEEVKLCGRYEPRMT